MFNQTSTNYTTDANEISVIKIDKDDFKSDNTLIYFLVPFISLLVIITMVAVVILWHRKRRLDRLRHYLMPFYTFAPGEEEDWETELLDSDSEVQPRRV